MKNHTIKDETQRNRLSQWAVNLALATNIFLAVIKTSVGILGHSTALLADGINSTSDAVYGLIVAVFIRQARKPADREHPFGHYQLESIAALTVCAFVITSAVGIFWDSVNAIYGYFTGVAPLEEASSLTFWVALLTLVLKTGLYFYTNRLGEQTKNPAVIAIAYDHRNDILSAATAMVGITLSRAGNLWVDPLAGALVALVVLRTGVNIIRQSASDLMDTVSGEQLENQVAQSLRDVPGIRNLEEVRAHRFGPYLVMNIIVGVDGDIDVYQGDQIATIAEQKLRRDIEFLEVVHIHYHPAKETVAASQEGVEKSCARV
jgi:cation diffusion facilitator family transporter